MMKHATDNSRTLVHTSHQTVRWGDMDALGHVNNTAYFRYMEQARIEWLFALTEGGAATPRAVGPVIVNASCDFLAPLVYPADLTVRMFLGDPGRTSIGSFYEIHAGGRKYADGASRMVWIDVASARPLPLPAAITQRLRALADVRA
jgi:acyl-CoA thioester hydrolase